MTHGNRFFSALPSMKAARVGRKNDVAATSIFELNGAVFRPFCVTDKKSRLFLSVNVELISLVFLTIVAIAGVVPAGLAVAKDASIAPVDSGQVEFMRAVRRKTYSETLQSKFLADQRDYFVSVSGPGFRTLQITAASMDLMLADQIRSDKDNLANWRELGFEMIELSDGQQRSWSMTLK